MNPGGKVGRLVSLLLVGMSLTAGAAKAQMTAQWATRYDGGVNGVDAPQAIAMGPSGTVYVTGAARVASTHPLYTVATLKLDSAGNILWSAQYGGSAAASGGSSGNGGIAVDTAGNAYVAAPVFTVGSDIDYAVLKYSPTGTLLWAATYDGPAGYYDYARAIAIDTRGHVYVTGYSSSSNSSVVATICYAASNGAQLWVAIDSYVGNVYKSATHIAVDDQVLDQTPPDSAPPGGGDPPVESVKPNPTAVPVDPNTDPIGFGGDPVPVVPPGEHRVFVCGSTRRLNVSPSVQDGLVLCYDADTGARLWEAGYDGPTHFDDQFGRIALLGNGVYVAGNSQRQAGQFPPSYYTSFLTARYDRDGNLTWADPHQYGSSNSFVYTYSLAARRIGSTDYLWVSGTAIEPTGSVSGVVLLYNAVSGVLQWDKALTTGGWSSDFTSINLAVDAAGRCYFGGRVSVNGHDCFLGSYSLLGTNPWTATYTGPATNGGDYIVGLVADGASPLHIYALAYSQGVSSNYDYCVIKFGP